MGNATIGSLRVVLGLDDGEFSSGLSGAQRQLRQAGANMQKIGGDIAMVGAGFTATVTAAFAGLGFHLLEGSQDAAHATGQVEAALNSMGAASGKTLPQLQQTAEALRDLSGVDDDDIMTSVTANLLTFGNVAGEVFDRAELSILNVSARMKTDLQGATMMVGKALNDPVKGLAALRRVGIQFTDQQEAQIKAMAKVNNLAGAQGIMLGELERQFGGAAEAAGKADIWMPLKTALMDLEGAFEPLIRDQIGPMIKGVADIARSMAALPAPIQGAILAVAGIGAAIGPVLVGLGAVVSAVGTVTAALGAGGLAAAAAGIGAVLLPVVAGVAAVAAAFFLFRDDIEPVLKSLWETAQASLGPALGELFDTVQGMVAGLASAFTTFFDGEMGQAIIRFSTMMGEFWGTTLIRLLTAAVEVVSGSLRAIGLAFSLVGDLLTGDFSGAWNTAGRLVENTVRTMGRVIEAIFPGSLDWMRRLYEGVRDWLQNKLGAVFNWVGEKVGWVGDQFFKLYDAVVGHSYVPDMVTETGQWFAKLHDLMVVPTERATEKTADRFRRMRDELRGVLQGLMTDQERAALELQNRLAILAQNRAAFTREQYEEQVRRARAQYNDATTETLDRGARIGPLGPMADGRDISRQVKEAGDRIKEQLNAIDAKMQEAADVFAGRFANGLEAALNSDLRGVLEAIFGDLRTNLRDLGRALFSAFNSGGGKGGGFDFASAAASIFNSLPKFATGGSILPGGSGGTDSQLVAFWKSPHERVDIGAPGFNRRGGTAMHFDLRGAVMTSDLLEQMEDMARASEGRAVRTSTEIGRRGAPALQARLRKLGTV